MFSRKILLLAAALVLTGAGCASQVAAPDAPAPAAPAAGPSADEPLIGGQRDEYGCLGPAGYAWDADTNACIRGWELDAIQRQAARLAVDNVGWSKGMTVIEVLVGQCLGCYGVDLERLVDGDRELLEVAIEDWKVTSVARKQME